MISLWFQKKGKEVKNSPSSQVFIDSCGGMEDNVDGSVMVVGRDVGAGAAGHKCPPHSADSTSVAVDSNAALISPHNNLNNKVVEGSCLGKVVCRFIFILVCPLFFTCGTFLVDQRNINLKSL